MTTCPSCGKDYDDNGVICPQCQKKAEIKKHIYLAWHLEQGEK
jgi:predicted amidophosphoribosyltransferase